ncbi:MAG: right-handed parallel beta-helix repeat-containing protein [bacterium]|nr:right-handed parallel beta-helix repeat-containing protein [bacterium]
MKKGSLFIALACTGALFAETYTVTTTADTGNGSLRQAILQANSHAGSDTIGFDIPETGMIFNGLCWFIEPFSNLPALTDSGTVIDGATQTARHGDLNANGPEIYLFGYQGRNGFPVSNGLSIQSSRNVVRGLIVSCFSETGIRILGPRAAYNRIEGNYIGTNFSGQDTIESANYTGIVLLDGAAHNTIGGGSPGQGNVISGNRSIGIEIVFADSNRVTGNRIGTDVYGARSVGNRDAGILLYMSSENEVGGTLEGEGNLISGNGGHGVWIDGSASAGNRVAGNRIGTNASGTAFIPNLNAGVGVHHGANRNRIGPGNVIRGNIGEGVVVFLPETVRNTITRNAINGNGLAGIDLKQQANGNIAAPIIAGTAGGISGSAPPHATVEIFSDPSDEGAVYEGTVTADASGAFSWTGTPAGPMITVTATDASGNTSEFSSPVAATGVGDRPSDAPRGFYLSSNFPNPFNASTVFRFGVPAARRVRLDVLDNTGRTVHALSDGIRSAGEHAVRLDASGMVSGVYVVRMETDGFTASRKIAVVK